MTYYSGVLYELYRIQRQWWVDVSVSKRLGNLRATLSARDPFNTNIALTLHLNRAEGIAKPARYPLARYREVSPHIVRRRFCLHWVVGGLGALCSEGVTARYVHFVLAL